MCRGEFSEMFLHDPTLPPCGVATSPIRSVNEGGGEGAIHWGAVRCLGLLDPDFAEPVVDVCKVPLRGANPLQLGRIDVLHDLGFLAECLKQR